MAWPAVGPTPNTMLHTPEGSLAWVRTSQSMKAVIEVNSEGLQTHVLPKARQGAIFQVRRYRGRFHWGGIQEKERNES